MKTFKKRSWEEEIFLEWRSRFQAATISQNIYIHLNNEQTIFDVDSLTVPSFITVEFGKRIFTEIRKFTFGFV